MSTVRYYVYVKGDGSYGNLYRQGGEPYRAKWSNGAWVTSDNIMTMVASAAYDDPDFDELSSAEVAEMFPGAEK